MIQNHLTSQPLSKRLKELGVPQKSEFYHVKDNFYYHQVKSLEEKDKMIIEDGVDVSSAFLSSELGELMPEQTICRRTFIQTTQSWVWEVEVIGLKESTTKPIFSSSMAEAMGLMLEHLILNGLIKL